MQERQLERKQNQSLPHSIASKTTLLKPVTPAPDYDFNDNNNVLRNLPKTEDVATAMEKSVNRGSSDNLCAGAGSTAELESLDSFKMTNSTSVIPSPPPLYFCPQKSVPPTMKKIQKPGVSYLIGEYNTRKEPSKFDFINVSSNDSSSAGSSGKNEDMSTRLKNELEQTLSRANLKKQNQNQSTVSTLQIMISGVR